MKTYLFLIVLFLLTLSCDNLFERHKPTPIQISGTSPSAGCNRDVTIQFRNTCGKDLIVYMIEALPASTFNCESLIYLGRIGNNISRKFEIKKGKIGYFVFAENEEGQCTGRYRKSELWVDCSNSNGNEAHFTTC